MHSSHMFTVGMPGGRCPPAVLTQIDKVKVFGINVIVDYTPSLVIVVACLTVPQFQAPIKFQDFDNFSLSLCICN